MVFNKPVKNKKTYLEILEKVRNQLGYYKHPKNLTEKDIKWLQKNVKQFNQETLNDVIEHSSLPDKPKEETK